MFETTEEILCSGFQLELYQDHEVLSIWFVLASIYQQHIRLLDQHVNNIRAKLDRPLHFRLTAEYLYLFCQKRLCDAFVLLIGYLHERGCIKSPDPAVSYSTPQSRFRHRFENITALKSSSIQIPTYDDVFPSNKSATVDPEAVDAAFGLAKESVQAYSSLKPEETHSGLFEEQHTALNKTLMRSVVGASVLWQRLKREPPSKLIRVSLKSQSFHPYYPVFHIV